MTTEPTAAESAPDLILHLEAAGVSLVLDLTDSRLPTILHWGAGLGTGTGAEELQALSSAAVGVVGHNAPDLPIRVAIVPEQYQGWSGRPGLTGARADGSGWSPCLRTTSVRLDGSPVTETGSHGAGSVQIDAEDEVAGLALRLTVELSEAGLVRARAELTNYAAPYALQDLVLALPVPAEASELLDLAGRWVKERIPQRRAFTVGTHLREGRKGRTGADAALVLHAGTPGFGFAGGEIWSVHTAWSGNHTTYAEHVYTGVRVLGGGELLLPGEMVLAEGESYRTPWIYGSYGVGLDAVAARFHAHLRSRDRAVDTRRPVTINVWEAVYFDHNLERLLDLAERAADLGVERYVLDDGWFGARRDDHAGLGDWVVSPEAWPRGLHPLIDRVRQLGMEFGLWFEPEMVNADSQVAREHPDWIMAPQGRWPVESRHQQVLNLGIPQAYEHVRDQMFAILAEYDIGYLKWDHNRDLIEAGTTPDSGRAGVHAQTLAVYRLMDELRAAHPGLEIESCASGGSRVDLGVLERTDRIWVSDCIDPLERQQMMRWSTQLAPPEYLGAHVAAGRSHSTGRTHDLGFRCATAVFGHLGIEWDLSQARPEELAELRAWIDFYLQNRELLLGGQVVRMDQHDPAIDVHGVIAPDRSAALFAYVVAGSPAAIPGPRLRLRGLDPQARYAVRPLMVGAEPAGLMAPTWWGADLSGAQVTGAMLAGPGLAAPILFPDQIMLFRADRV